MHMTAQSRSIRHDGVTTDLAVVGNMHVRHDPIVVTYARDTGILHRAGIEGAEFAYGVVIAYLKTRRLARIFLVLGNSSHRIKLEDTVVLADAGVPFDYHMRPYPCSRTDLDMFADNGISAHLDICGEFGVGVNDCGGMAHYGTDFTVHISSASAASLPSTSTTPLNLYKPRILRMSATLIII